MNTSGTSDLLGSVAIWCGLGTALTQLVDWLLPQRTKTAFQAKFEEVWFWLSEQKAGKLLDYLFSPKLLFWTPLTLALLLLPLAVILATLVWLSPPPPSPKPPGGGAIVEVTNEAAYDVFLFLIVAFTCGLALVAAIGYFFLPPLVRWITKRRSVAPLILRLALCSVITSVLPGFLYLAFEYNWLDSILFGRVSVILAIASLIASALFLLLMLISITWLLSVGVMASILRSLELIFLRLAEHPKGPVLGASALLAALGLLLRSFS
ncbi:MAG TPA: hypothetical protein VLV54_21535 [Thermoanaerobaculia bacterium]|nr:hypothetical protein [Thermoanaerobaculia bacterium]